jgi:hypothetical protein
MNRTILSAFLMLLSLTFVSLQAQETKVASGDREIKKTETEFKLGIQLRPRFEYLHGYKTLFKPDQTAGMNVNQRSRLNLNFKNKYVITRITLQDVRVWGNQPQLVTNEDKATSIHEAWAEALFSKSFSLKFGRQEIIYDDHRMFGNVDWAQQARSHDAAILKYKSDVFKAELAFAYNQDRYKLSGTDNKVDPKNYKAFQNLWMNFKPSDNFNVSFLFLNNGLQLKTGGDAYSQTIGPRVTYKNDNFTAHATFYYQGGYTNNQVGNPPSAQKLSASYIGADLSYKFTKNISALVGYERLSGDSQLESKDETNVFRPLYGTNHKFNGFMDYFYAGSPHGNVGLQDIYVLLKGKISPVTLGVFAHMFSSAADIADPKTMETPLSSYLGTEIDFFITFPIVKGMKFVGGYSQMFATESMEAIKDGSKDEMNNWAYAMIVFTPDLFVFRK